MKKKRTMIVILAVSVALVALGVGIGSWYWMNRDETVIESGLEPLEEDPGNVPDDSWTARY